MTGGVVLSTNWPSLLLCLDGEAAIASQRLNNANRETSIDLGTAETQTPWISRLRACDVLHLRILKGISESLTEVTTRFAVAKEDETNDRTEAIVTKECVSYGMITALVFAMSSLERRVGERVVMVSTVLMYL